MIGVLIATHGGFAEGLLNAVELIAGKQEHVKTIGLYHGDGIEEFQEKVRKAYEELEEGEGVLAFVDIFGGSPSNAVMKLMEECPKMEAITGVNMAMVVEAVLAREGNTTEVLSSSCLKAGGESQMRLREKYQEMCQATEEDFEEI